MRILVAGGFDATDENADDYEQFGRELGRQIAERGHTLLGGCQTLLDEVVAAGAAEYLRHCGGSDDDVCGRVISFVNRGVDPVHTHGQVNASNLASWDLNSARLYVPEPVKEADAVVLVGGWDGTYRAANWARIDKTPLLPVAAFGRTAQRVFEEEVSTLEGNGSISKSEFSRLSSVSGNWKKLASDVVDLAERMTHSNLAFVAMSFDADDGSLEDAYESMKEVGKEFGLEVHRLDESNKLDPILPKIRKDIEAAAFVIADLTGERPNVYYEIGYAHGIGKTVVVMAREGTRVHFDLKDFPVLFWKNQKSLKAGLRGKLEEATSRIGRAL